MYKLGMMALVAALAAAGAALGQEVESVYAPPAPAMASEGQNEGAVHLDLRVNYMTDYVYRGVEILEPPGPEDRPNLQFDGKLQFDLGKLPHPFIATFVNIANADPISRFQEVRPYFGADFQVGYFTLSGGHTNYIYPDRDPLNTEEAFGQVKFDDSIVWRSERPLLSPYIYAAYDYDVYNGWYMELGMSHDLVIEDTPITITFQGSVAYVRGFGLFQVSPGGKDTGFQHYQFGVIGQYSINTLLNVSKRYGEWALVGYVYYTDGIDNALAASTQVWGGAGVRFRY